MAEPGISTSDLRAGRIEGEIVLVLVFVLAVAALVELVALPTAAAG